MSILICGSRHPKDPFGAKLFIDDMINRLPAGMVILNGGATGIDTYVLDAVRRLHNGRVAWLGTRWTDKANPQPLDITAIVFRPNYKTPLYPKDRAPLIRNDHMLDLLPEMVIALWDGTSHGTKYVIDGARLRGIETLVRDT